MAKYQVLSQNNTEAPMMPYIETKDISCLLTVGFENVFRTAKWYLRWQFWHATDITIEATANRLEPKWLSVDTLPL